MRFDFDHKDDVVVHVPKWAARLRARVHFAFHRLVCRFGRHDYEAVSVEPPWVLLECFYCERKKKSHLREGLS